MDDDQYAYQWSRRNDILVRALTNRLYQQERQRIMEWREGLVKVVSLAAGSAAIAKVLSPDVLAWGGSVLVVATSLSLVFGYGAKARDAAKRATEWALLDRDINAVGPTAFTPEQINAWAARCNEIEAGEPAPNVKLLQRCYERACEAIGSTPSKVERGFWAKRIPAMIVP